MEVRSAKIPVFVAMLINMTALAAASDDGPVEQMRQSIAYAMSKYFTRETILMLLAIIILLVAAVALYEARRSKKIKKELLALALAKFDFQAEKLDLRLSNAAVLKKIVQKSGLQDPCSILKFSHVFESSLEKYYESEKIDSIPDETLAQIGALRKELGFSPLPKGVALTSTRQFSSGDKCTIKIPENDEQIPGICYVIGSDERQWHITRPHGWPPLQPGTWVRMNLTKPGDAEYNFRAQVLKDSDGEFFLRHTSELNRSQLRNWLRIDVNIPVEAVQQEEGRTGSFLSGKIIDISGGGLRIALPARLPKGASLLLNFELPGQGQITNLRAKVVRVARPFDEDPSKILYSAAFADELDSGGHEKIMKYVFEKQREDLSLRQF